MQLLPFRQLCSAGTLLRILMKRGRQDRNLGNLLTAPCPGVTGGDTERAGTRPLANPVCFQHPFL